MFNCADCKDYGFLFMVRREVWEEAVAKKDRHKMICVHCLQARLGRQLRKDDFDYSLRINDALTFGIRLELDHSGEEYDRVNFPKHWAKPCPNNLHRNGCNCEKP